MTYISAIIWGLVQGVAEFRPISSSGHLSIFQNFFNLTNVACGASALFRKVLLPESLRNTEPPNILSKSLVVHCTYLLKHILVDSAAKVKIA